MSIPPHAAIQDRFCRLVRYVNGTDLETTDRDFITHVCGLTFDELVDRAALDKRTLHLAWTSALIGSDCVDFYEVMLPIVLAGGVSPVEVKEILYMAGPQVGMARLYGMLKTTNRILELQGVELPLPDQSCADSAHENRHEAAMRIARRLHPEHDVDASAGGRDYVKNLFIDEVYGTFFSRGGLTVAERELCCTCTLLAQDDTDNELRDHIRGALRAGHPADLLRRVMTSCITILGFPRVTRGLRMLDTITGKE